MVVRRMIKQQHIWTHRFTCIHTKPTGSWFNTQNRVFTMRAASAQVRSFFLFCLSFISSALVSAASLLSVYKATSIRWRFSFLAKWLTTFSVNYADPRQDGPLRSLRCCGGCSSRMLLTTVSSALSKRAEHTSPVCSGAAAV